MKSSSCPFCKNTSTIVVQSSTNNNIWRVYCDVCGAFGPIAPDAKIAKTLWADRDYAGLEALLAETLKQLRRVKREKVKRDNPR